jgi:hypothetical protein
VFQGWDTANIALEFFDYMWPIFAAPANTNGTFAMPRALRCSTRRESQKEFKCNLLFLPRFTRRRE